MNTTINPGERFRKGFVLLMTIAYAIMFLALIGGFVEALLLAAVFSGIVYPLYRWLQRVLNGRNTMAIFLFGATFTFTRAKRLRNGRMQAT